MNALDVARQKAVEALRHQAMQRVHATVGGLHRSGRQQQSQFGPAEQLRRQGDTTGAAEAYMQHHAGVAEGHQAMPGWVSRALVGAAGGQLGAPPSRLPSAPGSVPRLVFNGGNPPHLPITPQQFPTMPGAEQGPLPAGLHPIPNADPTLSPTGLIHLGQGLFVHPLTGEIHGFGPGGVMTPVSPSPAMPVSSVRPGVAS